MTLSESDQAAYEELAAHFQFDAGLSRSMAERLAMRFIRSPAYRAQEQQRVASWRTCAWCAVAAPLTTVDGLQVCTTCAAARAPVERGGH